MTAHLESAGLNTDDAVHRQRVLFHYEDARIICESDTPIGLLKLHKHAQEWELIQIQVLPKYQGRGIGRNIIESILKDAQRENVTVKLSVLKRNPARRLDEELGFELADETIHDAILVWRPIP